MPDTPLGVRVISQREQSSHPQLIVRVRISTPSLDLEKDQSPSHVHSFALIDTGASKSCICPKLLEQLGCQPYNLVRQRSASEEREVYTRFASIALLSDDKVAFAEFLDVEVIEFNATENDHYKVLLGMDLLGQFSAIHIKGFEIVFDPLID